MTSVDSKAVEQSQSLSSPWWASPRVQTLLLSLVLAIGVVAIYYPVHWQPFANYDDPDYVTDNLHVKAGLHWETVKWAMTARDAANWHPVTWISHAFDWQIFGDNPAGPHDVNIVLHLLNALLLFWVVRSATGYVGRSWMVAALFALHPINVESVAWIAERKNLLSMMFALLALAAYRRYAAKPNDGRYLLVAGLFALGLMSKPQVITLPFVLLLWDYWPLQRINFGKSEMHVEGAIPARPLSKIVWEKIPLLFLCAASAMMTLRAQSGGGATSGFARALRVENAIVAYVRYIGKAFWPSRLALFYPYPLVLFKWWQVAGALFVLLAITAAVALAYRCRYLTVGWLWFLGTLVPMIGVVQVGTQAMADRYAYFSFVGLFIMVCWLVADWAAQRKPRMLLVRGVALIALATLAFVANRQVGFWNDHITLWTHTLDVTSNNWIAENNLGTTLLKQGRPEEAIPHFRAAVAAYPYDPNADLNLGIYEQMHGDYPGAIEWYQKAADIARNSKVRARAYNNLGFAYKANGDLIDARESLKKATQTDPDFAGAWFGLGIVAQRTGDLPLAISSYSRGIAIHATDYGYLLLAGALEASGEKERASAARQKAEFLSKNILNAQHYADRLLTE
jgi:tetratricopeptide (TPR) repeat protein